MIDMNEMMKKAQELSETMKQQQEELSKQMFSVSVGGEMVKMTFNGKQEAKSIEIDPEVVDVNDIETLQDLILSCLLYTSPSPRDGLLARMPSSA